MRHVCALPDLDGDGGEEEDGAAGSGGGSGGGGGGGVTQLRWHAGAAGAPEGGGGRRRGSPFELLDDHADRFTVVLYEHKPIGTDILFQLDAETD